MSLELTNTLGRKKITFEPDGENSVGLYTCGPTVYNYIHIGNLRTFIWEDILRRTLEFKGFKVRHVMNITDVDDKTIRDSRAQNLTLSEFTQIYTDAFFEDIDMMRIRRADAYPKATEHIDAMVDLIKKLEDRGHTYRSGGSIYFKISSFQEYGKLSGIDLSSVKPGARVEQDEYEKQDVRDFALWKETSEDEPSWDTSIGKGRPGWHIECSAMSMQYLGETFDIHTGAVDNIFPHHENEIAQSEAATGKPFVRVWLHAEHLIVEGEKMSKSKGNFFTLRDLIARGYDPLPIRYLLSSVPYRKKLNFTFEALDGAVKALERLDILHRKLEEIIQSPAMGQAPVEEASRSFMEEFHASLDNDLNTAEALAALFNYVKSLNIWIEEKELSAEQAGQALQTIKSADRVLDILPTKDTSRVDEIEFLIEERNQKKREKDYEAADAIRNKLDSMGIILEDTPGGVRWRRKI